MEKKRLSESKMLICVYMAYVGLGFRSSLLGTTWPVMGPQLGAPLESMGFLSALIIISSAASSFYNSRVNQKLGFGRVLFISCLLMGLTLLGIGLSTHFIFLLLLSIPLGLGVGSVDTGLNNYVATYYSSRHMNWLHGFWGMGATVGPLMIAGVLSMGGSWRMGFMLVAGIQICISLVMLWIIGTWRTDEGPHSSAQAGNAATKAKYTSVGRAGWSRIAFYAICNAVEVSFGLWSGSALVQQRGISAETVGVWVSAYYGAITAGRFLIGFFTERLGIRRAVILGICLALAGGVILIIPGSGNLALGGLLLVGLGLAPLYPCMMHSTYLDFSPSVANRLIGYQVTAGMLGAAFFPSALGLLLSKSGLGLLYPVNLAGLLMVAVLVFMAGMSDNREIG